MSRKIISELHKFKRLIDKLTDRFEIKELCDFAYQFSPKDSEVVFSSSKPVALTISTLVHGNETAGLAVLNDFLSLLDRKVINCQLPIGIIVGNFEAALENKRFLESDLNRSFGHEKSTAKTKEQKRSYDLQELLKKTAWLLDIHQTRLESKRPFFIFPYRKESLDFVEGISEQTAVVTHWGDGGFSKEGLCIDEYVNSQGGVGITLECGQAGFDSWQIAYGLKMVLQSISFVSRKENSFGKSEETRRDLYTIADTLVCPQRGVLKLEPGLVNFQNVVKGEMLANCDGRPILSPSDGWILFPNYSSETSSEGSRPKELLRVLKKINFDELPS